MAFVSRNHPQQVATRGPLDEVDDRTTPWEVFQPPPYSHPNLARFCAKARAEAERADLIVMLVPANRTEQGWWQDHVEPYRDGRDPVGPTVEFWRGRTRFYKPGQMEIKPNERPPFGCALLIWGAS